MIPMRRELAAVYDELRRRHRTGEKSVYLSDESLAFLREVAAQGPLKQPEAPPPSADQPVATQPVEDVPSPATPSAPVLPPPPVFSLPQGAKAERWAALRERVLGDPWCRSQVKPGKQVVFGVGSLDARIFFCGEAPGAEEEMVGEPFVGPAGQLLTDILRAMGLSREAVYIGNIMNYRPPLPGPVGNRPPSRQEMEYCLPYLKAQLEIVQPQVILALGKTAVDGLLGRDPKRRMTRFRGTWHTFEGIPLMPTFHPSYLLRNQSLHPRRQVWEDMLAVMDKLGMAVSKKQRGFFLKSSA
jgi:uracil-DNA glycosylase